MVDIAAIRALVALVPDPEIPVVSLEELGILRKVFKDEVRGHVVVEITPTYSGCPATQWISDEVGRTLREAGHRDAEVRLVLQPAWTSDWISDAGRRKLKAFGIAPPGRACSTEDAPLRFYRSATAQDPSQPECPHCGSPTTEKLAEFGSTPCKSLYRCLSCREPFDYFKPY